MPNKTTLTPPRTPANPPPPPPAEQPRPAPEPAAPAKQSIQSRCALTFEFEEN